MDIAEQVQRYEHQPRRAQGEDHPRPERDFQARYGRREPSQQVARVPEEERERDEARRLEDPRRRVRGPHAQDLLREDGEEHCGGEGQEDGAGEVAELFEERPEADDFAGGVRGGRGTGGGGGGVVGVAAEKQHEG